MTLTQDQEQLLLTLVGRVTELENKTVSPDYAEQSYVDNLFPLASTAINKTLSGDLSLQHTDPSLVVIDCNGGERTIRMPGANTGNRFFIIMNKSS